MNGLDMQSIATILALCAYSGIAIFLIMQDALKLRFRPVKRFAWGILASIQLIHYAFR